MKFNEKLIKLRKSSGYTQENLAEKLGVTRQAVARWEAGDTTPDMAMLLGLCDIFSVSADYLIHDDYESDEDIPVVKEKNEEISAAAHKKRMAHLIAGAAFTAAWVYFATACMLNSNAELQPLFTIPIGGCAAASVSSFILFFRTK